MNKIIFSLLLIALVLPFSVFFAGRFTGIQNRNDRKARFNSPEIYPLSYIGNHLGRHTDTFLPNRHFAAVYLKVIRE